MRATELLLYLLAIPLAANFIAEWSGTIDAFKRWLFYRVYSRRTAYSFFRLKPFDCAMCLSWWLGAAFVATRFSLDRWYEVFLPFGMAALGYLISKLDKY